MEYQTLKVRVEDDIGFIELNRPEKLNALSRRLFEELQAAVEELDKKDITVVILSGNGRAFSAGLDFYEFLEDVRKASSDKLERFLYERVVFMQDSISSIEHSSKVYIAAISGFCVGGGLDIASTCDIRFASRDAVFSIMETRVGVVADLGALQRLPRIIGEANTRLLAYTARKIDAKEAYRIGLVNGIYDTKEALMEASIACAKEISSNPIEAIEGTKKALVYGISATTEESLRFAAEYNARIFDFDRIMERFLENVGKKPPKGADRT